MNKSEKQHGPRANGILLRSRVIFDVVNDKDCWPSKCFQCSEGVSLKSIKHCKKH